MAKKYAEYIELSPHYESVVSIESETNYPDMWKDYIVHEDMKDAIDKICDSLKREDEDKRRSFWIHGAYGTGKSYAAIVLKHLFEDSPESIRLFLSNQMLISCRNRFLSIKDKGEFLVVWRSQATDIKNGTQLLMAMENAVRERLKEKFGDSAYYGKTSLVSQAKDIVNDLSYNWSGIFANYPEYFEKYGSVEDFRRDVNAGDLNAVDVVARICREKGWSFLRSFESFKGWIADVIAGNHLKDTGIIFIWDEFTSYLRNNPTDDLLQPLSEFCKEQPFFMFLIVHRAPSWVSQIGAEIYDRIVDRFHSIEFHVSESAAYELIGSSILTRSGMDEQWNGVKDELMKSIDSDIADFDNLDLGGSKERFRQLCPLHPMTLSLLAIVAQNFGASQRTLFRFMKDKDKSDKENVGFIHYINTCGPDGWRWLTPDFLWDYFFATESDVRDFSGEARNAYSHFMAKQEFISDDYRMRVFKAAMLLIGVMSAGSVSNLYSRAVQRRMSATRSTLYKCFAGMLTRKDVDSYLKDLADIGVLSLDHMTNGDIRLQIPFSQNADVFNVRRAKMVKDNTRYQLLGKKGVFASSVEKKLWEATRASYGRMCIAVCDSSTASMNARFNEVKKELTEHPFKFGVLAVAISDPADFAVMQDRVKKLAAGDTTGRMAVYLMKSPLTKDLLDRWYDAKTRYVLASEEGKSADAGRYSDEANAIVEGWAAAAADDRIMVVCGDRVYPSEYGASYVTSKLEREIIFGKIFTAAPERVVETTTAFKNNSAKTALAGVQKVSLSTQVGNIVNGLKQAGVWEIDDLEELSRCGGNDGAEAVAQAAKFILDRFSRGTQINLKDLWAELQKSPYGYYNCMACGYILGFLLRYYRNTEFSWVGGNNTWPLNDQNLADMIFRLCKGDTLNHYLSPGSEAWRNFKPYVKNVFRLEDKEAANETEARKFMSRQCTEKAGMPFWTLKYVPAEKFGGVEQKRKADEIVDLFCEFLEEHGNQEKLMGDIVDKFKGTGSLRKTIEKLYFDRETVSGAWGAFVLGRCPELRKLKESIGLSNQDLFDAIRQMMQTQISNWTEPQADEKLSELCVEYRAVVALNDALNVKRTSLRQLAGDIRNAFNNMKIPGSVVEKLGYDWALALKAIWNVSTKQWTDIDPADREKYTELLEADARKVWGLVTSPKPILRRYLEEQGQDCTDEELDGICRSLKAERYDSSASDFDARVADQLLRVESNRNRMRIQALWKEKSGFDSIDLWCANFAVPIQWAVGDEARPYIAVLKAVQDGKPVNHTELYNARQFFETHSLAVLRDAAAIKDGFIRQIGENYRGVFESNGQLLISRLKTNAKLTSEVYSWVHKAGEIRQAVDAFMRDKFCAEARENVKSMPEDQLREKVVRLLEENPALYTLFLK